MRKQTKLWTTKDGSKIRICDMEDSHLDNTINLLKRCAEVRRSMIIIDYISYPEPNGEMAKMALESEIDYIMDAPYDDFLPPIYDNLIAETERRKKKTNSFTSKLKTYVKNRLTKKEKNMQRKFYIAGVKFHSMPTIIKDIEVGESLTLIPEPANKYDPNAVRIMRSEIFCGYVPKKFSSEVASMLEVGVSLSCTVSAVNPSAKPWEMCEVVIKDISLSEDTFENITESYTDDADREMGLDDGLDDIGDK